MDKSELRYIDVTPTWTGVLALLLTGIESDNGIAREAAQSELYRMAKLADAYVELKKAEAKQ